MLSKESLKIKACGEIDKRASEIIEIARTILSAPEPGFREFKTAKLVAKKFAELGIPYRDGIAITGVKGVVKGGASGPSVCVMGELDSLIVPDHPFAEKKTGAAHVCGHNCQVAMMLGVAAALTKSGVLSSLAGNVVFIGIPAEEYIEIEFRDELRRQGKLHYLGGKPEFVKLGEMEDVDIAMMTHTSPDPKTKKLGEVTSTNGLVAKRIQFLGKSAHAGGMPHKGINALNAAMIALSAIHAQRETFRDEDSIRVHPIITKGGDAVNAVPADVRMETFVRGKSIDAFMDANAKVDRALKAGAMAIGAKVKITTLPGYMPFVRYPDFWEMYKGNAVSLVGESDYGDVGHMGGSTDMGDLSQVMPVIHPFAGGVSGTSHGSDYLVNDYNAAVITPAKAMAMTAIDLLADGAVKAKELIKKSKPPLSKKKYLALMDSLLKEEEYQG